MHFISQFHPGLNQLNGFIKTAYKILENSSETKSLYNRPPRVILKNIYIQKKHIRFFRKRLIKTKITTQAKLKVNLVQNQNAYCVKTMLPNTQTNDQ